MSVPRLLHALLLALVLCPAVRAQDDTFYSRDSYPRLRLVFAMDNWHDLLVENRQDSGVPIPAELYVDEVLYPNVGVKHKGDASYTGKLRENTKILVDHFVPGQTVYGYDVITLDAGRQSSIFNEVATLFLLKDWADVPLSNLANLECGTLTNMKRLGVFTNTERVDGKFIEAHFGSKGHRYGARHRKPFVYMGTEADDYVPIYSVQGGDEADVYQDIADASVALEVADKKTVKELMDQFAETDACMRILLGHRMAGGWDGLEDGNNYYLCEEERHASRIIPVPWDVDLTWQSVYDPMGLDDIPLGKLFESKAQRQRAQTMVRHYLEGALSGGRIADLLWQLKAQSLHDLLHSPFDDFDDEADVDAAIYGVINMAEAIHSQWSSDSRFNREMPTIVVHEPSPPSPMEGDEIRVTATIQVTGAVIDRVNLWSRTVGAFVPTKMHDDGMHHDGQAGDGVFGAALPAAFAGDLHEYYVEARPLVASTAQTAFEPRQTEFRPLSVYVSVPEGRTLLLNEVVSDNESGDRDEAGDRDDWVEIINTAALDHDLSGAWLSDERDDPRSWQFPAGSVVPAGGYLRVWCDDEVTEGPLHASFAISRDGEFLRLTSSDGTANRVLDEVVIPGLDEDDAWARVPDAGRHWFHVARPTGEDEVAPAGDDNRYDVRRDGAASGFRLRTDGDLEVGEEMRFELRDGPPNSLALIHIGIDADRIDIGARGWLVVDLSVRATLRAVMDGNGDADLRLTVPDVAAGLRFHAQALALQADFSNGVVATIQP